MRRLAAAGSLAIVSGVALALAAPARAAIHGFPHDFHAGTTRTVTIVVWRQPSDPPVAWIETVAPDNEKLVGVTADDPAWQGVRTGRIVRWTGPDFPVGKRLRFHMSLRFTEAGDTAVLVRVGHGGTATDQAPINLFVAGSASGIGGDVTVVLLAGAAIFVGLVVIFLIGRKLQR